MSKPLSNKLPEHVKLRWARYRRAKLIQEAEEFMERQLERIQFTLRDSTQRLHREYLRCAHDGPHPNSEVGRRIIRLGSTGYEGKQRPSLDWYDGAQDARERQE